MTNFTNTVLYTGVTSSIAHRVYKHKEASYPNSFTTRYACTKLVWFQYFNRIEDAIDEEKRIKAGSRQKKIDRINELNPDWDDLWDSIQEWL